MLTDPLFIGSVQTTVKYVIVLVPGLYVIGLGLALLVKRPIPLIALFRGMLFLPNVISLVVIGLIWKFLLVDRIGVVNTLFSKIGLGGQSWLGDPDLTLWTLLAVTIWFLMGFYMLIFLAGLQDRRRGAMAVLSGYHPASAETDEFLCAARVSSGSGYRTSGIRPRLRDDQRRASQFDEPDHVLHLSAGVPVQ
jgi:hypothetical protein